MKLLKYYPAGLMNYCHASIKDSPADHLDKVIGIINAIRLSNKNPIWSDMEEYELKNILKSMDQVLYTEEWGKLCKDLYIEKLLAEPTEAVTRYFFNHPLDLIEFIENKGEKFSQIFLNYRLPDCAYKDHDSLIRFAESLVTSKQSYLLGSILGRSICGTDGIFPHESIRDLLEFLGNDKVDQGVYTGFINNLGARWVSDGRAQKQLGKQFLDDSISMEIKYPHTASILRDLSKDYERKGQNDYLRSELDS